jgi:hypothetical protein
MAKTTRRPRTEEETTPTHGIAQSLRLAEVTDSDIARREDEPQEQRGGVTLTTGFSQRTNCEMPRDSPQMFVLQGDS